MKTIPDMQAYLLVRPFLNSIAWSASLLLSLVFSQQAQAQHSALHEALSSLPPAYGYEVSRQREVDGELLLPVNNWEKKKLKGDYLYLQYKHTGSETAPFDNKGILRHYLREVKKRGGKGLNRGKAFGCYQTLSEAHQLQFLIEVYEGGATYTLVIAKSGDAPAGATAKRESLYDQITASGRVSLYFNFATGESTLSGESGKDLKKVLQLMEEHPELRLKIEGHTDNVGDEKRNQALSEMRANAIKSYLVTHGVASGRITAKGFGSSQPIASNKTEEGRLKNRRVDLVKLE